MATARRSDALRFAASLVGVLAVSACAGEDAPPTHLIDGSRVGPPPALESTDVAVRTRVDVVEARRMARRSAAAACLRRHSVEVGTTRVVVRMGVNGETATFRSPFGHSLYACDNSVGAREGDRRWCGEASGRLEGGRLRDPRLDLAGCRTATGEPVAFAWIEPYARAAYVAVRQQGFIEVYEVAGGLPVRITTTTDVDLENARASFDVSEHDQAGRLLREHRLEASVAG